MKTEEEIRKYIDGIQRTLLGDPKKLHEPEIHQLLACSQISALKWVIGENQEADKLAAEFEKKYVSTFKSGE